MPWWPLLPFVDWCTQCVAMPTTATGDEGGQARPRQLSGSNSLRHPRLQPRQPLHPMSAHPQSCIRPRHTNTTATVLQSRYCDAYYFRSIMIIAKNSLNVSFSYHQVDLKLKDWSLSMMNWEPYDVMDLYLPSIFKDEWWMFKRKSSTCTTRCIVGV